MDKSEIITCSTPNLYTAFRAACKTSPYKKTTMQFAERRLTEIARAQEELHARTWSITPMPAFRITERGRPREIRGNYPYDRMILHSYLDYALAPELSRKLIYDNYASQEGKGTSLARQRFEMFLHECFRRYGTNAFRIQMTDLSKFYDNVQHAKLKNTIRENIEWDSFHSYMIDEILRSFRVDVSYMTDAEHVGCMETKYNSLEHALIPRVLLTGEKWMDKSIDIGNHASQIFSIFYPTRADTYVKCVKSIRPYGRYMDDSFIMSDSVEQLRDVMGGLREIYADLGLYINENKTQMVRADHDFKWLGRIYRVTNTGKVLMKPQQEIITRERRKLKKYASMLDDNVLQFDYIFNQFRAWQGVFYPVMSKEQRSTMDRLYDDLFIKKWRPSDDF